MCFSIAFRSSMAMAFLGLDYTAVTKKVSERRIRSEIFHRGERVASAEASLEDVGGNIDVVLFPTKREFFLSRFDHDRLTKLKIGLDDLLKAIVATGKGTELMVRFPKGEPAVSLALDYEPVMVRLI